MPFDMKLVLKRDKQEFHDKSYSIAFYTIMHTGMFFVSNSYKS